MVPGLVPSMARTHAVRSTTSDCHQLGLKDQTSSEPPPHPTAALWYIFNHDGKMPYLGTYKMNLHAASWDIVGNGMNSGMATAVCQWLHFQMAVRADFGCHGRCRGADAKLGAWFSVGRDRAGDHRLAQNYRVRSLYCIHIQFANRLK